MQAELHAQTWEDLARGLLQNDFNAKVSVMKHDIEAKEQPWERKWAKIWTSSSIRLGLFVIDSIRLVMAMPRSGPVAEMSWSSLLRKKTLSKMQPSS
jgi:hypothetical protein